jgi:hypothetical protein
MASLVLPRLDKETENSFFTKRFGGFQPMQALNQHEPSAVRPYLDRCLLAPVEHARGDFVYALLIKSGTPLDWHVDVRDRDGLALQHADFRVIHRWYILALLLSDYVRGRNHSTTVNPISSEGCIALAADAVAAQQQRSR